MDIPFNRLKSDDHNPDPAHAGDVLASVCARHFLAMLS